MKRLYIVVRNDLPEGLRAAQACHAAREFTLEHPGADVGENLIVLETSATELALVLSKAAGTCFITTFHEPDLGGELTAAAFDGRARKLLSCYPRAFRPPRELAA